MGILERMRGFEEKKIVENTKKRYQLRYAAGEYWLLDMEQEKNIYKKPLKLNALGADIFKMRESGVSVAAIIKKLCEEYQEDESILEEDVYAFLRQLKAYGIDIQ